MLVRRFAKDPSGNGERPAVRNIEVGWSIRWCDEWRTPGIGSDRSRQRPAGLRGDTEDFQSIGLPRQRGGEVSTELDKVRAPLFCQGPEEIGQKRAPIVVNQSGTTKRRGCNADGGSGKTGLTGYSPDGRTLLGAQQRRDSKRDSGFPSDPLRSFLCEAPSGWYVCVDKDLGCDQPQMPTPVEPTVVGVRKSSSSGC